MKNRKVLLVGLLSIIAILIAIFVMTTSTGKKSNSIDRLDPVIDYENYGKEPATSEKGGLQLEQSVYYLNIEEATTIKVISSNDGAITWSSSDESVAQVDENGNVSGLKEGRVKIYARLSEDEYATVEVVVVDPSKTTKEEAQKEDAINAEEAKPKDSDNPKDPKETNKPEVTPTPGGVTPTPTPEPEVNDNEEPVEPSPVIIEPGPTPTPTPPPPVTPTPIPGGHIVPVQSVTIDKTNVTGYTLEEYTLIAAVSPVNTTYPSVFWESSDTNVVTVNNGVLKFKTAGTAVISAWAGGVKAQATVTVKSRDRIHFISHGEASGSDHTTGDAILLESNGSYAMIDMGNIHVSSRVVNYLKNNNVKSLDFVLFTHMDSDHAGNLQAVLESGVKVKNIWMKNYDVAGYQKNYVPNYNANGIDKGLGTQDSNASTYALNKALSRYRRIIYLSNYSSLKDLVGNIKHVSDDADGNLYTFKNLKFTMALYNNKRNVSASSSENFNSISSLITVNGHKVLLTGDDYDTKKFNNTASRVGKVDLLKVQHHGSRHCSLIPHKYNGDVYNTSGTSVSSTALNSLKPNYYVVTSSRKKIANIRTEYNVTDGNMCVDKLPSNANVRYVDETSNVLIVDLSDRTIRFITK